MAVFGMQSAPDPLNFQAATQGRLGVLSLVEIGPPSYRQPRHLNTALQVMAYARLCWQHFYRCDS